MGSRRSWFEALRADTVCWAHRNTWVVVACSVALALFGLGLANVHTAGSNKIGPNTMVSPFDVSGAPPPCVDPGSVRLVRMAASSTAGERASAKQDPPGPQRMGAGPRTARGGSHDSTEFAPFASRPSRSAE